MVTPDLVKLQVLNDLVNQTIDVINQRAVLGGGLAHTPYQVPFAAQPSPYYAQPTYPITAQMGLPQALPFATQAPTVGLGHTPYAGVPAFPPQMFQPQMFQPQMFQPQMFQQIPGQPGMGPVGGGLMHTPFIQPGQFAQPVSPWAARPFGW